MIVSARAALTHIARCLLPKAGMVGPVPCRTHLLSIYVPASLAPVRSVAGKEGSNVGFRSLGKAFRGLRISFGASTPRRPHV